MLLAAAAVLAQTAEQTESVEPLRATSLYLVLGIIVVVCFAIVLAGLGYFSPSKDGS